MGWQLIRYSGGVFFALLLALLTPPLMAEPESVDNKPQLVEFILTGLGINGATAQIDRVIAHTVGAFADQADSGLSATQTQQIQQLLISVSGSEQVNTNTAAYVASQLPENTPQAVAILSNELVVRAGNFDVSLEMRGAVNKFKAYEQALNISEIAASRVALLQRLDTALQSSVIAAMLQTELELSVQSMAVQLSGDKQNDDDGSVMVSSQIDRKRQPRQQYMAAVLLKLNLYSYRFMKDQELERYVELLEDSSIQTLLGISQKGLLQSLHKGRAEALLQLPGNS